MNNISKLSPNYITALIISGIIILFAVFAPFKIAYNITDSLPQRFFLIFEGRLPKANDYVSFTKINKWKIISTLIRLTV